jgi:hypothetical protein
MLDSVVRTSPNMAILKAGKVTKLFCEGLGW